MSDETKPIKPDCYKCVHRLSIPGDCHSRCNNHAAKVEGNPHGMKMGWFIWPYNFDPTWLKTCDGFSDKTEDKKPRQEGSPMAELMALLR